MVRLIMGWTLDYAESVAAIRAASTAFHNDYKKKKLDQVDEDSKAFLDWNFQHESIIAANTDLQTKWLDRAEHGEGCRGDFLVDRSRATHSVKLG